MRSSFLRRAALVALAPVFALACSSADSPVSSPKDAPSADAGVRADIDGSSASDTAANDASPGDGAVGNVDAPVPDAASKWASPALPPFDAATVDYVRTTHAHGQTKGNRDDVVMKAGDSITASPSFFFDIGIPSYTLDTYASLKPMIDAINAVIVDTDNSNSFTRQSIAAESGLITRDALMRDLVNQEIQALRPSYAIMMFGSDDLEDYGAADFKQYMETILGQYDAEGVVVAISTIPRRLEYLNGDQLVSDYNATIKAIASVHHLPLIDLFAALEPLANHGISDDDVHPTVELAADGMTTLSGDFTKTGLTFGYNVRNLTALQMLDRMRALR